MGFGSTAAEEASAADGGGWTIVPHPRRSPWPRAASAAATSSPTRTATARSGSGDACTAIRVSTATLRWTDLVRSRIVRPTRSTKTASPAACRVRREMRRTRGRRGRRRKTCRTDGCAIDLSPRQILRGGCPSLALRAVSLRRRERRGCGSSPLRFGRRSVVDRPRHRSRPAVPASDGTSHRRPWSGSRRGSRPRRTCGRCSGSRSGPASTTARELALRLQPLVALRSTRSKDSLRRSFNKDGTVRAYTFNSKSTGGVGGVP